MTGYTEVEISIVDFRPRPGEEEDAALAGR
jgi:hypothetical protein